MSGLPFRLGVGVLMALASAVPSDVLAFTEVFAAGMSRIDLQGECFVPNRIGAWPTADAADRLFVEIENLDEGDRPLRIVVIGAGCGKRKGGVAEYDVSIDLPDQGCRVAFVPLRLAYKRIDRKLIDGVRFQLEDGAKSRFFVRRLGFLAPGEVAPAVREAPYRHRADEKAHADDLVRFRASCGKDGLAVGQVTSMEAVRPRAGFSVRPANELRLRLAQNEWESLQLVIASTIGDLKDVRVEFSDLSAGGARFFAANVACAPVGYVETKMPPPYKVRPRGERPARGWWPDAILDFTDRADVSDGDVQSFWIRVHCPKTQTPGIYRGWATVRATSGGKRLERRIPFALRVNGFALPDTSMLPLAVSFSPAPASLAAVDGRQDVLNRRKGNADGMHNAWRTRERSYGDFLARYLITWNHLYLRADEEPRYETLAWLGRQGRLGLFNLSYWWYYSTNPGGEEKWRATSLPRLRARYEKAKAAGIADHAFFYGCDERPPETFEAMSRTASSLHAEFPGVKVMTTARDRKLGVDGSPLGAIDVFCPATCFWDPEQVKKSRAAGHEVWWYFCNNPSYPFADSFVETPPAELRSLMGAQTVKYRPDGFLYYSIAYWNGDRPLMKPFGDWDARTFGDYHGDGQWTCCGGRDMMPLPTLRLENFRDGLEDYAYAKLLERRLAAHPDRTDRWSKSAEEALRVPKSLVESLRKFSIDPDELYAWRTKMADLLESD